MRATRRTVLATTLAVVVLSGSLASADLIGRWVFQEPTGPTVDHTDVRSNAARNGDPQLMEEGERKFHRFDGAGDFFDAGAAAELNLGSSMTLVAWVRYASTGDNLGTAGIAGKGSPTWGLMIANKLQGYANDVGSLYYLDQNLFDAGHWILIAITYDAANSMFTHYRGIDDVVDPLIAVSAATAGNPLTDSGTISFCMGTGVFSSGAGGGPNAQYFKGDIDEVHLYDEVLSAAELDVLLDVGTSEVPPTGTVMITR